MVVTVRVVLKSPHLKLGDGRRGRRTKKQLRPSEDPCSSSQLAEAVQICNLEYSAGVFYAPGTERTTVLMSPGG